MNAAEKDELYPDALQLVCRFGAGSTSFLQRRLRIGYWRAVGLINRMQAEGIVGPSNGIKPRKLLNRAVGL